MNQRQQRENEIVIKIQLFAMSEEKYVKYSQH